MTKKITELPAVTTVAASDLIVTVDMTGPTTKKSTITQFASSVNSLIATISGSTFTQLSGSLQKTSTGNSYLVAGANTTITSQSNGQIFIASSAATVPTGTGVRKVVAGVEDAAASLIVNADVDAAAAIAGTKVAPDFGAQNITTTGNALLGATPRATVGSVRLPNVATAFVRNVGNTGDQCVFKATALNEIIFGSDDVYATGFSVIRLWADTAVYLGVGAGGGAVNYLRASAGSLQAGVPIIGLATPYSVHGTVISAMTDVAGYVVPAADYQYSQIEIPATLAITAARDFRLPTPATEAASYVINVRRLATGAFNLNVTRADGAGVSVALAVNQSCQLRVRPAGVYIIAAIST